MPSINDFGLNDFNSEKEYEYWRRNAIAQLEADNAALKAQVEEYELLKRAVNENSGDCLPECDSYGHAEGCEYVSMSATMIIQQRQVEGLREVARAYLEVTTKIRQRENLPMGEGELEWYNLTKALEAGGE